MNNYLVWFRIVIVLGFIINMTFAIPAIVAPQFLSSTLGLPLQASYPWLNNTGMLLFAVSVFYLPAGVNPIRWFAYSWLCVISRLVAVIFWIWLVKTSEYSSSFTGMMYSDGIMFLVLLVLLQLGLPSDGKITIANLRKLVLNFIDKIIRLFSHNNFRTFFSIILVIIIFSAYQSWNNLLREIPQPVLSSDEEHFKYGAIGLGPQARLPRYIFEVMPTLCSDNNNGIKNWSTFGFVFEAGNSLPIGLAKRHIGFPTIEPTCSFCHTGTYQASVNDKPVPILAGPASTLNLEKFQWFLYNCASNKNFTVTKIMSEIQKNHDLGIIEGLFYRFAIIPLLKSSIQQQQVSYSWQKRRPSQGPGRTDTFNPTKINVFKFPDDSSIGTVDLPQIWNQKPREGMWLHWDGNNNAIKERNYAAAMAVGATPNSVLPKSFERITDWLLQKPPAKYPFTIDTQKSDIGKILWDKNCANCHDFGKVKTGQVTTDIRTLGTDRYRLNSFTIGLVDKFHTFKTGYFTFSAYRKTQSYSNTPTDGIWARAPYLHNGSVPTLWDLLQPTRKRPKSFYRGYQVYDSHKVGYITTGINAKRIGFLFDTTKLGNSNSGHNYGVNLSNDDKWNLIEFMKTL